MKIEDTERLQAAHDRMVAAIETVLASLDAEALRSPTRGEGSRTVGQVLTEAVRGRFRL